MRFPLAAGLLVLLACSDAGPSNADVAGTWHLLTINGQPLPYRTGTAAAFTDILADSLTLADPVPQSHWRTTRRDSTTTPNACCNQTVTNEVGVSWTVVPGDSVLITAIYPAGDVDHHARVNGDTLRISLSRGGFLPDGLYLYRQQ